MKFILYSVTAASLLALSSCGDKTGGAVSNVNLKTSTDSLSYCLGISMGEHLNNIAANVDIKDLDFEMLMKGIKDQRDSIAALEIDEASAFLDGEFDRRYDLKMQARVTPEDKYMEDNKTKEGVQITASGLQYKVLQEGGGIKPAFGDTVIAHYTGQYSSGEIFQSTVGSEPAEFVISPQMVEGWNEGMQLMSEGSKYMIYIPWKLGYGKEGSRSIEPYSNLIFEIELIKVKKMKM